MAYVTRATTWPNGTILFDESTKNLVARVYELLDSKDPSSGARLAAEVFSEDGLFAGGTGRFEGFHGRFCFPCAAMVSREKHGPETLKSELK